MDNEHSLIFNACVTGSTREDIAEFLDSVSKTLQGTQEDNGSMMLPSEFGISEGDWDIGPLTIEHLSPSWVNNANNQNKE